MSTMEPIPSGLRLTVVEGGYHAQHHPLERALISIGRSTPETVASASYLTFPEPTVSRLHAVLTWEAGARAYLLHHRSQTNPTVLNSGVITGPMLLKAGDRITLGRLVLVVEPDQQMAKAPESAPVSATHGQSAPKASASGGYPTVASSSASGLQTAIPSPATTPSAERHLNARIDGSDRTFSAPLKESLISLSFSSDRATAAVAGSAPANGWQEVRLPGPSPSSLRFELDAASGACQVQAASETQVVAYRLSPGRGGCELRVPLKTGQSLSFLETDVILHQGYRIWLGNPEQMPESIPPSATTDGPRFALQFLNGPWKDAFITCPSESSSLRLAPGDFGFRHPFPAPRAPHADITVQSGVARLLASEVPDDQFLEVDGDLVFASESVSLVGGSRLNLGDAELLWTDGSEARYSAYRLRDGETVHPIRKTSVRLGTAAHCEIMLPHRELPPVIGRLTFEGDVPNYLHTDLSATIRVDGEELSPGLSVPLKPGSQLELKPGLLLHFELDPTKT